MIQEVAKTNPHPLDFLFHPRSVAVVGVSSDTSRPWGGGGFVRGLQAAGFPGPIYPVNPKVKKVLGLPCYPTLRDIPGPVDYVICAIPEKGVLQMLDDAAAKGVRAIHLFTSGFRETGDDERAELERQVLDRARAAGIRLIGPNCMGLYCPASGISWWNLFPTEPGKVAFISQSGLNAEDLILYGSLRGIRFSKVISYGNATDLDESELLEYCTADPETEVIALYVEGVKDGQRFLRALRTAAAAKPTVLLKGGLSAAGTRAARSHTGSLAGSATVWEALAQQAGVVRVKNLEELEDIVVTFLFLGRSPGSGVGIVLEGGGSSVVAADAAERAGLHLPALPQELQARLRQFVPIAGTGLGNPVDLPWMEDRERFANTVDLVASAPGVDLLLVVARFNWVPANQKPTEFTQATVDALVQASSRTNKPVAVAVAPPRSADTMTTILDFQRRCARAGLPVYPSIDRALNAIANCLRWQEQQ
ncbi:MAG: acetate--CoA ligase family protein [Dehalococcoidia bacterium]